MKKIRKKLYLFTLKEWIVLITKEPMIRTKCSDELKETMIVLESLQFSNLKEILLKYPQLLLIDAIMLSEKIQELLTKYHDMSIVQKEILSIYIKKDRKHSIKERKCML